MGGRFKVCFIGAGSIGFTRKLLSDMLTVPEFRDIDVADVLAEHVGDLPVAALYAVAEPDGAHAAVTVQRPCDHRVRVRVV